MPPRCDGTPNFCMAPVVLSFMTRQPTCRAYRGRQRRPQERSFCAPGTAAASGVYTRLTLAASERLSVAAIQLNSQDEVAANLEAARKLVLGGRGARRKARRLTGKLRLPGTRGRKTPDRREAR